jgi:hypothetical protein
MRSSDSVYSNEVQSEGETIAVDPEDNERYNLLRNFSISSEYSVGDALGFAMGALREIVLSPWTLLKSVLGYIYMGIQLVIIAVFKPVSCLYNTWLLHLVLNVRLGRKRAPRNGKLEKPFGRIAVIGELFGFASRSTTNSDCIV